MLGADAGLVRRDLQAAGGGEDVGDRGNLREAQLAHGGVGEQRRDRHPPVMVAHDDVEVAIGAQAIGVQLPLDVRVKRRVGGRREVR